LAGQPELEERWMICNPEKEPCLHCIWDCKIDEECFLEFKREENKTVFEEVIVAKRCADSGDWCDSLIHFNLAVQAACRIASAPLLLSDDVDEALSRCVGYIGGKIQDAVSGGKK
jgi:hypothetical protein